MSETNGLVQVGERAIFALIMESIQPPTLPAPLTLEQLAAAALALPEKDRASLVEQLLQTLPPDDPDEGLDDAPLSWDELSPEWREELQRRIDDLESGRVQGIPWEEVKAEGRRILDEEGR